VNGPASALHGARALLAVCLAGASAGCTVRETDLQKTIPAHDVEAVKRLLASGADLGASVANHQDAWELALQNLDPSDPRTIEIARLVLRALPGQPPPANMRFSVPSRNRSSRDTFPAIIAARQWSPDGMRLLLDNGLDLGGLPVRDAFTAAAGNGCEPIIRMLLDAGLPVDAVDSSNDTALAMARRVRNPHLVALLTGIGAQEKAPPGRLGTALQNTMGAVFGAPPPAGAEPVWVEGKVAAAHPVGQAALALAQRPPADGSPRLPPPDDLRRGLEAGSVIVLADAKAELYLVTFEPAPAGAAASVRPRVGVTRLVFVPSGASWALAPGG
jgi:hypothetical protein